MVSSSYFYLIIIIICLNTVISVLGSPCGIMANMLNSDIIVCEFKLQSHNYVHFQTDNLEKGMNLLVTHSYRLNSSTNVLQQG